MGVVVPRIVVRGAQVFMGRKTPETAARRSTMNWGELIKSKTFWSAVSIVVAACEVPVAKHGNRAASSKSGAARA